MVDEDKELARVSKELKSVIEYISTIQRKLENENFVKRAPENVVKDEQRKLEEQRKLMNELEEKLNDCTDRADRFFERTPEGGRLHK